MKVKSELGSETLSYKERVKIKVTNSKAVVKEKQKPVKPI